MCLHHHCRRLVEGLRVWSVIFATFKATIDLTRCDAAHDHIRGFRSDRNASGGNEYFCAPLLVGTGRPPAAWISADACDVAVRGALTRSPLHGDLCRSSRLWPQRLSRLRPGPCAICETGHGEGHGFRHGETWVRALLNCRA